MIQFEFSLQSSSAVMTSIDEGGQRMELASIGRGGVGAITQTLDNLVTPQRTNQALRMAGAQAMTYMRIYAPFDTGNLKNTILVEPPTATEVTVNVGAEYGIYQEMGTRFQPGTAFVRPTLEVHGAELSAIFRRALGGG